MSDPDPSLWPIAQASAAIAAGRLSPVELVEATLARVETYDGALNSFATLASDHARAAAHRAEAEIRDGRRRGPLHGIPFATKDNYDSAGILTACQSHMRRDHVPTKSAAAIERMEQAGAILIGKCATAEFGTGGPSPGMLFPPARNPWDHQRYTGGSSTGSGAAVGAGLLRVALGSDTGGSVRGPAAFCGAVGLKPTYGLVSRRGVFPLSFSLDHCGPIARSVEDAAITLGGMAGPDPLDPASAMVDAGDYVSQLRTGLRGLRIGYLRSWPAKDPITDPEVMAALDTAAAMFQDLGAMVEEIAFEDEDIFLAVGRTILISEYYAVHQENLLRRPELYERPARERLMVGAFARASDYVDALRVRRRLALAFNNDIMARYDLVLTSSAVRPAWRLDEMPDEPMHMLGLTTYAFNVTGNPAMSLPSGFSSAGLPLSLQIIGRMFDEATVLRAGAAYEEATNWMTRRPALAKAVQAA
ncbi:amidase [Agaricicola taiwanensis]|uniref:Amidase n=1 Tax=Agaricicola taiwanensis TaxID=591372 RepID=A0A8J2VYE9_9RHOB|nr:amidase [Agaricicola taiwanensis]GGE41258.1 amidase [Agaricicola taiwanensis]